MRSAIRAMIAQTVKNQFRQPVRFVWRCNVGCADECSLLSGTDSTNRPAQGNSEAAHRCACDGPGAPGDKQFILGRRKASPISKKFTNPSVVPWN